MNHLSLIADIPVSPNATDPASWGQMIQTVGIPMGCLILFVLPGFVGLFFMLRWMFGPDGYVKDAIKRWVDAQVEAFTGIRADTDDVKDKLINQEKEHSAQQAAHAAMKQAGHKALNVLGIIAADKPGVAIELQQAHDSLNQA